MTLDKIFLSSFVLVVSSVGILPDNPLYFFKELKEEVRLFIFRDPADQADILLRASQEKLSAAALSLEKGNWPMAQKLLSSYGGDLEKAKQRVKDVQDKGGDAVKLLKVLDETTALADSLRERFSESTVSAKMPVKSSWFAAVSDFLGALFAKRQVLRPITN